MIFSLSTSWFNIESLTYTIIRLPFFVCIRFHAEVFVGATPEGETIPGENDNFWPSPTCLPGPYHRETFSQKEVGPGSVWQDSCWTRRATAFYSGFWSSLRTGWRIVQDVDSISLGGTGWGKTTMGIISTDYDYQQTSWLDTGRWTCFSFN